MRWVTGVASLVFVTVLAGCFDGKAASGADDETDFTDLGLKASDDTGIIRGLVLDTAIVPVADVQVTIQGPDLEKAVRTNPEGAFGFDGLEPGTYFIKANKDGYLPSQHSAEVVAGVDDPDIVRILLEPDPTLQPYVTLEKFDGYLECSVRGVIIGVAACQIVGTGADEFLQEYGPETMPRVPAWIQSELVWDSTQVLGDELSLAIDCLSGPPCPNGQVGIGRAEGTSPLVVTIDQNTSEEFLLGPGGQPLIIRVFAFGNSDTDVVPEEDVYEQMNETTGGAVPCIEWPILFESCVRFGGAGLILFQDFTVYTQWFYGWTPPEGYQFSVDGEIGPP